MEPFTDPRLPVELLDKVILEAWSSSLSNKDRITLMTSYLLVNQTWKGLFLPISFRDVHIPSRSYLEKYQAALAGYSSLFSEEVRSIPASICQSITIKIPPAIDHDDDKRAGQGDTRPPMGEALSLLLYFLDGILGVPNLRTLRIHYENIGPFDILNNQRLSYFPQQATDLEISFSFNGNTSISGGFPCLKYQRRNLEVQPSLSNLKRLCLFGVNEAFVADINCLLPKCVQCVLWRPYD